MTSALALFLTAAAITAGGREASLIERGGDPARGILVNCTPGSRPFDPPDPGLPTVVFVHGLNPAPRVVHFTMTERVAEALSRRRGPPCNVLGWDWNSATFESLRPSVNSRAAVHQGQALAWALWCAGVDPASTHLIGHSSGSIVATSAAHFLSRRMGRPLARLTLLEPAAYYHPIIFEQLEAGSLCRSSRTTGRPAPAPTARKSRRMGSGITESMARLPTRE